MAEFSPEEEVALRRQWVAQLEGELEGRSSRQALKLIAHRTAGAPPLIGLEAVRTRARVLQLTATQGDDDAVAAGLDEARGWMASVARAATPVAMPSAGAPSASAAVAQGELKVLVVDDDPVQRALLERRLTKLGHQVTVAADGRSGLKLGLGQTFDIILMDRMLPDIDGPRVLMMLRSKGVSVPAALLTATAEALDNDAHETAGIRFVLEKPVSADQLLHAIVDLRAD